MRGLPGCCLAILVGGAVAAAGSEGSNVKRRKRSDPPAHGRWKPFAPMTDEFEGGKLDTSKWYPNNPQWKGRQPAFFHTHNVTVSDGKLHLTMRREDLKGLPKGYHTYTSAAVKSKAKVRYGYFEIKCRPMDSRGSSAFWFYDSTPETWTEIDVFEIGARAPGHEHTVHMNAHVFHTLANPGRHWSKGGKWKAPYRLADGYHVYALEWDSQQLQYYVDGVVVRRMPNTHWHQPLHLNFDSETMPKWFGLPEAAALPSTFSIEYVRAWKRVGGPPDDAPRSCELLFPGNRAASPKGRKTVYRLKTDGEGRLLVLADLGGTARPRRVTLAYDDKAFYDSQKANRLRKTVSLKDTSARRLSVTFSWSKSKAEKRNNAYRLDAVDVRPAVRPAKGGEVVYAFVSEEGKDVRLTIRY